MFDDWQEIGAGSFGRVFKAKTHRGTTVAIKTDINHTGILRHETTVLHYLRRMGCKHNIPMIVWFGNAAPPGATEPYPCLAMPYYTHSITSYVNMDAKRAAHTIRALLRVIAEIHHCGVIHRDMKPDNIMINADGALIILDFGLAAIIRDDTHTHFPARIDCTEFTGTPAYASIYAHSGISASRRDDLIAIGYIWIALTEGALPWDTHLTGLRGADTRMIQHPTYLDVKHMKHADSLVLRPGPQRAYFAAVHRIAFDADPDYDELAGCVSM